MDEDVSPTIPYRPEDISNTEEREEAYDTLFKQTRELPDIAFWDIIRNIQRAIRKGADIRRIVYDYWGKDTE